MFSIKIDVLKLMIDPILVVFLLHLIHMLYASISLCLLSVVNYFQIGTKKLSYVQWDLYNNYVSHI